MIRFMADADLHEGIVLGCLRREPAIEFLTAREADLRGVPDSQVLERATKERRVLVSHDCKTMPIHFGRYLSQGGESSGVVLVPQDLPLADAIEEIVLIWAASEPEEWTNRIVRLPLA